MKLTPNATDPAAVAVAAQEAGADAVSLVNTLKGMALDPKTGEPWLGGRTGGVSGPAIRAIALEQVAAVAGRVEIPVIGMGGIATGRHAADFVAAGASAVAVGTESFRDPAAGRRVAAELASCPSAASARTCLDDRLIPYGGQLRDVSPQRAGTFRSLCDSEQFAQTKPLQTQLKTLKEPQPASS